MQRSGTECRWYVVLNVPKGIWWAKHTGIWTRWPVPAKLSLGFSFSKTTKNGFVTPLVGQGLGLPYFSSAKPGQDPLSNQYVNTLPQNWKQSWFSGTWQPCHGPTVGEALDPLHFFSDDSLISASVPHKFSGTLLQNQYSVHQHAEFYVYCGVLYGCLLRYRNLPV